VTGNGLGRTRQATTTSEYGLLHQPGAAFRLDRLPPDPELAGLVERHWVVTWDLPTGQGSSVTLLPQPCVNLVFDSGRLAVIGVGRARFTYPLSGSGRVFGVKFRPGGFAPFIGRPVGELTDGQLPAEQVWGADGARLERALGAAGPVAELVELVEEFLRRHWPAPDPNTELVGRLVRVLLRDRSVTRVDDICRRYGISPRSLQRLFRRYVGVSPKWVLQRYRLHEAAARLAEPPPRSWAEVATELGYFDQSHFINDFTAAVGLTPAQYAAACAEGRAPVPG
jgi:AraC-like DNA-binding protein